MKDKILMLIIGILIGAIITAGGFLVFGKNNDKNNKMIERNFDTNMVGGGRRGNPLDENNIGEPPEKPIDQDNASNTTENT